MNLGFKALSWAAAFVVTSPSWADAVTVVDPWIAEAPPGAYAVGAFMTISNSGDADRKLTSVSTTEAERVEMHMTIIEDGVASMVEQAELLIPAHAEFVLKPGGYHIMLIHPKPMRAGDTVPLVLGFANGETLPITAEVRKRMSGGHMHEHQH